MFAALIARAMPPGSETVMSIMFGTLQAMVIGVANYWLGSMTGSKEKTRIMSGRV